MMASVEIRRSSILVDLRWGVPIDEIRWANELIEFLLDREFAIQAKAAKAIGDTRQHLTSDQRYAGLLHEIDCFFGVAAS
jgi:hypothetical protein